MLLYPKHIFNAYRLRYIASFGIYALTNSKLCDSTGLEPITFRLLAGLRPLSAKKKNTHLTMSVWSGLRGSNPPPPPWQGGALPNELNPRKWCLRSESNQRHRDFQSLALPTELQRRFCLRDGDSDGARTHDL